MREHLRRSHRTWCGFRRVASARQHLEELLKLSPDEWSAAAEVLLESLEQDEASADGDQAWATEIQRRVERNAPGVPAEQVFADGRARLKTEG
jgi:hypothetical protein